MILIRYSSCTNCVFHGIREASASLKVPIYAFLFRWIGTKIQDERIGIVFKERYEKIEMGWHDVFLSLLK